MILQDAEMKKIHFIHAQCYRWDTLILFWAPNVKSLYLTVIHTTIFLKTKVINNVPFHSQKYLDLNDKLYGHPP